MLMNPFTGSVCSYEEWMEIFKSVSSEEWGGENFEDAYLVEVTKDEEGNWIEM